MIGVDDVTGFAGHAVSMDACRVFPSAEEADVRSTGYRSWMEIKAPVAATWHKYAHRLSAEGSLDCGILWGLTGYPPMSQALFTGHNAIGAPAEAVR